MYHKIFMIILKSSYDFLDFSSFINKPLLTFRNICVSNVALSLTDKSKERVFLNLVSRC